MTYSIVARDERTGELGVAVASHAFAAGHAVAFAEAGVGAVATQGSPVTGHAERLLTALGSGESPAQALAALVDDDGGGLLRQSALVSASGDGAAHTGALCIRYAGHVVDGDVSCQGNLLAADGTWDRMLAAYRETDAAWELRLLAALDAGLAAGGDLRGQQSAALVVVGATPGTRPRLDLRVDDHPAPLRELRRLIGLSEADLQVRRAIAFATGSGDDPRAVREALDQAQRAFGEDNREPDFWSGLIAAGLGETHDRFPDDPRWIEFRRRLLGLAAADEQEQP